MANSLDSNYNAGPNIDLVDLKTTNLEPVFKINLRGKKKEFFTQVGKTLSIILPTEPNTSTENSKICVIWLSTDEWLIYNKSAPIDEYKEAQEARLEENLYNKISLLKYGSVTNVSDHWEMICLEGKKVYDLLSSGCPYNFNEFKTKKGAVVQTILNHIDVIIHNRHEYGNNTLFLFVRRSFAEHLCSWMNDSARFI